MESAGESGIEVALEYHGGTLTTTRPRRWRCWRPWTSLRTYWQPPQDLPDDAALAELQQVMPRLAALHVFSWWPGPAPPARGARGPGGGGRSGSPARAREDVDALLEFVPGDDAAAVAREARTMDELLPAGARA